MPTLPLNEDVLFYAFRYALGRMTYAVDEVAEAILANAENLRPGTRELMLLEIADAGREGHLGMRVDQQSWQAVARALEAARDRKDGSALQTQDPA